MKRSQDVRVKRRHVWYELRVGYYAPSGRTRQRNGREAEREWLRWQWDSGRHYLTTSAPVDDETLVEMLNELVRSAWREIHRRPMLTMDGAEAASEQLLTFEDRT